MKTLRSLPTAASAVFLLALTLRTVWPIVDRAWLYQSNGDEGVYYASAVALLHGLMPYDDFTFVHPPGILLVLLPFAALGNVLGDSVGIFLAREGFVLLGCLNAALVTTLLWRRSHVAAWAGGIVYASWGVSVVAELRLNLVTVQSTLFLLALLFLQRQPRRLVLSGALIGLTCAIKIWALPYVLVALPFIYVRFGPDSLQRFTAGLVGAPALVCLPFVAAHPMKAFEMVVAVQVGRDAQNPGLLYRASAFVDGGFHGGVIYPLAVIVALVGAAAVMIPVSAALLRRQPLRAWSDAAWLGVLLVLQGAVLLAAPSFFNHYTAFVAPAMALTLGLAAHHVLQHRRSAPWIIVAVACASTAAVAAANRPYFAVPHEPLAAAVEQADCVWSYRTADLAVADALTRNFENDCDVSIDSYGEKLHSRAETGSDSAWDERVREQLSGASAVIPSQRGRISPENRRFLRETFDVITFEDGNFFVRVRSAD